MYNKSRTRAEVTITTLIVMAMIVPFFLVVVNSALCFAQDNKASSVIQEFSEVYAYAGYDGEMSYTTRKAMWGCESSAYQGSSFRECMATQLRSRLEPYVKDPEEISISGDGPITVKYTLKLKILGFEIKRTKTI